VRLLDANVLLYAYDANATHHAACRRWLERAFNEEEPVGLPWQTLLAFVRIVSNPRAVRSPLASAAACELVAEWLARPQAVIVEPGERFWSLFRKVVDAGSGQWAAGDRRSARGPRIGAWCRALQYRPRFSTI